MIRVIFRKTPKDNEIIAFFPDTYTQNGEMDSYMHVGQHERASIHFYWACKKASPEEYKSLYDELVNIVGYDDLAVRQKMQY